MSAYIRTMLPFMDQECLIEALVMVGFVRSVIEVHEEPVNLVGYNGVTRSERANIVVRRVHLGRVSNDLGFLSTPTGYLAISDYDTGGLGSDWLGRLAGFYAQSLQAKQTRLAEEQRKQLEEQQRKLVEAQKDAVYQRAKKMGYNVQESKVGDKVRLVLVKRVF